VRGTETDIARIMSHWEIEPNSEVEFRITAFLRDTPTLGLIGKSDYGRQNRYVSIEALEASPVVLRDPATDLALNWKSGIVLRPTSHTQSIVHSSHADDAANAASVAAFVARASEAERTVGQLVPPHLVR
jgi:hypothetical protein